MGRSRYKIFDNAYPHFLTCTVINWLPLFSSPAIVQIIFDSLIFLQQNNRLVLYAYIVLENHLHLVASSDQLAKEIGHFKSYTARRIIDFLVEKKANHILKQLNYHKLRYKKDRTYQMWQEGFHPKQILNADMMRRCIGVIRARGIM